MRTTFFGISRKIRNQDPPRYVSFTSQIISDRLKVLKLFFGFHDVSRKLQISWAIDLVVFAKIGENFVFEIWSFLLISRHSRQRLPKFVMQSSITTYEQLWNKWAVNLSSAHLNE
ncbi:hypothetical protein T03_16530 [Trichinella britovi]|uniref:Uncharacterized protein n=1 Tax=Trichinella britovi TaxID=45882 RepID=A0A0V1CJ53_TRIBR|nr:hypothetical protein T03_16530 [Trichinella britovi]